MEFDFYKDDDLSMTHIEKHGVTTFEIAEFFDEANTIIRRRKDGSYMAIGRLKSGRYLEVIYRLITEERVYVITAYDLRDQSLIDYLIHIENGN